MLDLYQTFTNITVVEVITDNDQFTGFDAADVSTVSVPRRFKYVHHVFITTS